ncbi:hypothetical protein GGTG_05297 [Gaeumannomyces tritici R3-111a-1]|uniref:BTB domain-containing protein n=1 Tax=Gaeumannomyces tritici (strain R3-111a-1) TaxID=644352 RepID=J3NVI2_GAET3|nr:hypothetical protein GGTG_05297 [Gaeumannomyces tritici R3-111a-1]EJT75360.1 hypothetical protein GGTG_05297 [Gaeumannomyces tritici R3-111a-1]
MASSSTAFSATSSLTPSASAPPSPSLASVGATLPTESFDELGDLQLIIGADGPDQARFTVCSRALSRTSPVLKAMLGGPWLEKRPANGDVNWVVALPEDDRRNMEIILAVAHGSFRRLPRTIGLDDLYQLCFCIDKYDISEGLMPWVDKWCSGVEAQVVWTTIAAKDAAKVLWIGWVLGNLGFVEKSAERLLKSTKPSEVATLASLDPTGLIGDIQKMQLETVHQIVKEVNGIWTTLTTLHAFSSSRRRCISTDIPNKELCDAATLGKLTVSLVREGFFDQKKCHGFDITSLLQAVSRIADENFSLGNLRSAHRNCGPSLQLKKLQEKLRKDLPAPVTKTSHKIVAARRKNIGVDDDKAEVKAG